MSYFNTPPECKFHLRGNCKKGARCEYLHGGRNPIPAHVGGHCYHVPIPKKIHGGVVAGKRKRNFRSIEEGLLPHIVHLSLPQKDTDTVVQVQLEAPNEELFRDVKEKLKYLFASFSHIEDDKESASLEHSGEEGKYLSVEWVTRKLQDSLKRLQSEQKQNPNLQGKLEVILGRKIWHSLSGEVVENNKPMSVEELLDIGSKCHCAMNTSVDASKVDKVSRELKGYQRHSVEIYNFILTLPDEGGDQRKRVDVQVMAMESGELKIIRVVKNDDRLVAFDVICPNRQHDFRLELNCHEIVHTCDAEFIAIKKLVESMSLRPGKLTFTPCNGWKVIMLSYKRRSTFLLEDTFMVTISDVKECCVNWEKYSRRNEGDQLTVNLEDVQDRHWELELSNILWECAFAKDVGQTPEQFLSLYMEHPSVDPTGKVRVTHPWDPETFISQDLHNILEKVDWLSEQLT